MAAGAETAAVAAAAAAVAADDEVTQPGVLSARGPPRKPECHRPAQFRQPVQHHLRVVGSRGPPSEARTPTRTGHGCAGSVSRPAEAGPGGAGRVDRSPDSDRRPGDGSSRAVTGCWWARLKTDITWRPAAEGSRTTGCG